MTKDEVSAGVQQETLDASMQSVEGLESESMVQDASVSTGVKGTYIFGFLYDISLQMNVLLIL